MLPPALRDFCCVGYRTDLLVVRGPNLPMAPLAKQLPCFLALKAAIAYEFMKISLERRWDEMELLTELFRVDEAVPASPDAYCRPSRPQTGLQKISHPGTA